MPVIDSVAELTSILEAWDRDHRSGGDPTATLTRIAELVEQETEAMYKMDPDPFDDRHPGRAFPSCAFGHLLKALFKNDVFMNTLVNSYMSASRNQTALLVSASRLLLDIMIGLETPMLFQENEGMVEKLVQRVKEADEPLRSYSIGLLAGAMEIQDIATVHRQTNDALVPLMIKCLHELRNESKKRKKEKMSLHRPFANIGKSDKLSQDSGNSTDVEKNEVSNCSTDIKKTLDCSSSDANMLDDTSVDDKNQEEAEATPERSNEGQVKDTPKNGRLKSAGSKRKQQPIRKSDSSSAMNMNDCSNSSWAEMEPLIVGSYSLQPLTLEMQQRLILQYLTPIAEYQELIGYTFEGNALELILSYIDLTENKDVRLAFEALRYLAVLLCHKKFAIMFISRGGVETLLAVYRPSVAATGVSKCLYYLSYFEDTMERVCLLPHHVLTELVHYVLWLGECSHESGRCHAAMFFSMSFSFRVILELFDAQDGLRKLINQISTLDIMRIEEQNDHMDEDDVFQSRQAARHVCVALKRYFEAHLALRADQIRRSHMRNEGGSPLAEIPAYKAAKFPPEVIQDNIELLLECLPLRIHWEPVSSFIKLGGISLLLQLVAMAAEWSAYPGKCETIRSALDVLAVCTVTPRGHMALCDYVQLPENTKTPAISILIGVAEGEILMDADVQRSALNVIINCVCSPMTRFSNSVSKFSSTSAKKKSSVKSGEDLLSKMWNNVRTNNGIMVLLKLLMIKMPITEADSIRALACKALLGLVRSETVRQIISKLPFFNNGQFQQLMREPVLQDKRQEHVKFCKYAKDLVDKVSGKPQNTNLDASLDRIKRASIVSQTQIRYQKKELLQLIHQHLLAEGLTETAIQLQKEAELPRATPALPPHPHTPQLYSTPSSHPRFLRQFSTPSSTPPPASNQTTPGTPLRVNASQGTTSTPGSIKVNIINSKTHMPAYSNQLRAQQNRRIIQQKNDSGSAYSSPAIKRLITKQEPTMSLDRLVVSYLKEQHAMCKNPVATCPQFSLFSPHRCPEPKRKISAPTNVTARIFRRATRPQYGGLDGLQYDRKFVYSRFRPIRSYRDTEEDGCFSCCAFSACEQYLILGTYAGEMKYFNLQTAEESLSEVCHSSPLSHLEAARDGKLVLTSSSWGQFPLSALWNVNTAIELSQSFREDTYVEFSHITQDRVLGTQEEKAHVYDVATGQQILKLYHPDKANNYTKNRATFNPTDDLILNDGVLWDVNSGKPIHKFDKFNPNISGVFHPKGLELIINSEVWDLRTFHLLHTVPALDQSQIRFNHNGDVIYGAIHQTDEDAQMADEQIPSPFGSSFRTFDATDYSNIATVDVKKNIFDLCTDQSDCYLAVIENQRSPETLSEESICRLYEVGRLRDDDDDQGDDEDEEGMDDNNDEDDDGSADVDSVSLSDSQGNNEDGDTSSNDGNDSYSDISISYDNDDDSDIDDDDDDDDDMEDMYFELSDGSNLV